MSEKTNGVKVQRGFLPGHVVQNFYGTAEQLKAAGIVTDEMLHMEEWDNGFGICTDENGSDCTVIENHGGPGVYLITKYVTDANRTNGEKDFSGKSIDGIDVSDVIARFAR